MESKAIVKPASDESLDPIDMVGSKIWTEHYLDGAAGRKIEEEVICLVCDNVRWRNDTWHGRWCRDRRWFRCNEAESRDAQNHDRTNVHVPPRAVWKSLRHGRCLYREPPFKWRRTSSATEAVTNRSIDPPSLAISFTSREAIGWSDTSAIRKTVSILSLSCWFMPAIWNSYSKSATALSPRRIAAAPCASAKSMSSESNSTTSIVPAIPPTSRRTIASRSSTRNIGS